MDLSPLVSFTDCAELPATNYPSKFQVQLSLDMSTKPPLLSILVPLVKLPAPQTIPALLQVLDKEPRRATKHLPQQSSSPLLHIGGRGGGGNEVGKQIPSQCPLKLSKKRGH